MDVNTPNVSMNSLFHQVEIAPEVFEVTIRFDDLTINKHEIGLSLGYAEGIIPKHFNVMVDEILLQAPHRCNIRAGYCVLPLKNQTVRLNSIEAGGTVFQVQKIITAQLRKSEFAAFFLCTIGPAMETWSKELLRSGDPAMGYLVDVVASIATEAVTDRLHDHISSYMKSRGMSITNRYSPGYCGWSVAEQHLLFSKFPPGFCGIKLTETALMIPIKSVSGIIGIGANVKWRKYLCDTCGIKECTYRASREVRSKRTIGQN
jgi:hypothetical protein